MKRQRVGVIGAGAAGLCAGRNMIYSPDKFKFVIFELWDEVGGTWNFTEMTGLDEFKMPIHSSMYRNLKTNVPKEIMGFPDFPFQETDHSFTHHTNVLEYLKNYAKKHNLYDKIKFRHHVNSVAPEISVDGSVIWKLLVTDLKTKTETLFEFDSIMICNGHYAVPNKPVIPGIENYKGVQIHSHSYRDSSPFAGKTVIVLGAASSGMDIAIEVAAVAKLVYLSHNQNLKQCPLPENLTQVPGIQSASSTGFSLQDQSHVEADVILYCTGYLFDFPFLTETCKVRVEGNRVMPLYKHLLHMDFPTLCFVGLPFTVLPFPMFHFQTRYFIKTLDGTITLPSREEMNKETEIDFRRRVHDMKMPAKHAHKMGPLQWDYFQELGNDAQVNSLPPVYRMIYDKVEEERKENVMWYKKEEYRMLSAEEFERTMPGPC